MKEVTGYQTIDGVIHPTIEAARESLTMKREDKLRRAAYELVDISSNQQMVHWLSTNTSRLRELVQLADDLRMEES